LGRTGISREHLAIEHEDAGLFVTDLSTNGTWINGTRIPPSRKCKIDEQDSIEVPGYELRYRILNRNGNQAARTSAAKSGTAAPSAENQATYNPSWGFSILDSFTAQRNCDYDRGAFLGTVALLLEFVS
jgi:predicted component of type VI protein secretion system